MKVGNRGPISTGNRAPIEAHNLKFGHSLPQAKVRERLNLYIEYLRRDPNSGKLRSDSEPQWKGNTGNVKVRAGFFPLNVTFELKANELAVSLPGITPGYIRKMLEEDLTKILKAPAEAGAKQLLWSCHKDKAAEAVTGFKASS